VEPPINRVTRGGVDLIPLRLPPSRSLSLPSLSLSLSLSCILAIFATVVLPRPLVQLPPPARFTLAPPLCAVLLRCHIRSNSNPSGEMATEEACIPDPRAVGVRSTMSEAKI
jgi:hypothetical protein